MLMPHSITDGDACFAYFNKKWGIPDAKGSPLGRVRFSRHHRGGSSINLTRSMETVCIIPFRNAERLEVTRSRNIIAVRLASHRFGCSVT